MLTIEPLSAEQDAALARMIRANLEAHHLDIPGTAYFDEALDHLSAYYHHPERANSPASAGQFAVTQTKNVQY